MFSIGELISYGCNGVCKVEGTTMMKVPGSREMHEYYVLRPIYRERGMIYCPVDVQRGFVRRKILTKEESLSLLSQVSEMDCIKFDSRKDFEEKCKTAVLSGECTEWMKVFKTLCKEQRHRQDTGKRMTATQERFMKTVRDNLCGELAVSLEKELIQIESMLQENLEKCAS